MIKRSTWILLIVFIVLLGGTLVYQRYKTQKVAEVTPTQAEEQLLNLQENAVATIKIEDSGGKVLLLGRDPNGMWVVQEPKGGGTTDIAAVEAALTQLLALRSQFTLDLTSDLSQYGLAAPVNVITITLNGGEQHVIKVGGNAPAVSAYYVRVDNGAPKVVDKTSLDPVLKMLTTPPYVPTPTPTGALTTAPAGTGTPASTGTPEATLQPTDTATPVATVTTVVPATPEATATP